MLIFFALAAAATSWLLPRPELDARDAEEVALGALAEVGIEGEVSGEVELVVHRPMAGGEVDAWSVPVDVDGEEIELRVQESAGRLVYVDDRIGPDDTERLLSDEEYEVFQDYRDDAVDEDWVRENAVGSVAAVLIAGIAFAIAKRTNGIWR